jgi:SSS family solute:Na+ symporter
VQAVAAVMIVAVYVAVLTFVALKARAARSFTEFSLAGRALPLTLVFGSLAATFVGPAFSSGFVGKGYTSGFIFLIIGLAYSLQNIFVGFLIAPRLRALHACHTLGDVMGQKYNRTCQILAGLISVGLCAGLAALMIKAGGGIVTEIFELPLWSAVIIVGGITTLYTTFGGLRASVITDAFQFTAFSILLPVIFFWIIFTHVDGGFASFVQRAGETTRTGWASVSALDILGLITAFLLGETLIPPICNRALASKSTRVSRNGFLLAGSFSAIWFVVMLSLGILAAVQPNVASVIDSIKASDRENAVLLTLARYSLPVECYALIIVVLISIIMSSLDSLLNAGAVALTEDVVKPFVSVTDANALYIGRCATVLIAAAAAAGALAVPSIIKGLLYCYSIWAPAVLPALMLGLWIKRPRPWAGILSMVTGTLTAVFSQLIIHEYYPAVNNAVAILPALAGALIAYAVGHWADNPYKDH